MQISLPLLSVAARAWAGVLTLLAIPYYIRMMSVDDYGVIALFTLIGSFVLVLDFGIPAWLTREFAKPEKSRTKLQQAGLLRDADRLCLLALFIISLSGVAWSSISDTSAKQIAGGVALVLGCLTIAAQWIGLIYNGIVQGRQNYIANALIIGIGATVRVGLTLGLLYVEPSLTVYFFAQLIVSLGQVMAFRYFANDGRPRNFIQPDRRRTWLRRAVRFSMVMTPMTILSVTLSQADKVMVGYFSSIEDFSIYMLAWALPGALGLIAITPIGSMALAVLAKAKNGVSSDEMWDLYTALTSLMVVAIVPVASIMVAAPGTVLMLWGLSDDMVAGVGRVLPILVVATAVNGIMSIPYALQIATGWTQLPLLMNVAAVVISLPTSAVLAYRFGLVGAASGWLMTNLLFLIVWPFLMHRRLFRARLCEWLGRAVLLPASVAIVTSVFTLHLFHSLLPATLPMQSLAAVVAVLVGLACALLSSPTPLRFQLLSRFKFGN